MHWTHCWYNIVVDGSFSGYFYKKGAGILSSKIVNMDFGMLILLCSIAFKVFRSLKVIDMTKTRECWVLFSLISRLRTRWPGMRRRTMRYIGVTATCCWPITSPRSLPPRPSLTLNHTHTTLSYINIASSNFISYWGGEEHLY